MPSNLVLAVAGLVASYIFLQALVYFCHDPKEPPMIVGTVPFLSPVIGMLFEQGKFYTRMR
jgi:hypothetical protein